MVSPIWRGQKPTEGKALQRGGAVKTPGHAPVDAPPVGHCSWHGYPWHVPARARHPAPSSPLPCAEPALLRTTDITLLPGTCSKTHASPVRRTWGSVCAGRFRGDAREEREPERWNRELPIATEEGDSGRALPLQAIRGVKRALWLQRVYVVTERGSDNQQRLLAGEKALAGQCVLPGPRARGRVLPWATRQHDAPGAGQKLSAV